jgi:hypothetical protein
MKRTDRIKMLEKLNLPTESPRQQVLEIFEDLCIAKRNTQDYFLIQEVYSAIKSTWEGKDMPTMSDVEFYLDQAALSKKTEYRKHAQFGYRYLHNQP